MQTRGHAKSVTLDWIVLEHGDVVCVHCGTHELIGDASEWLATIQLVLRRFIAEHARCGSRATPSAPSPPADS